LEITGILRGSSETWNHKFNLIGISLTKPFQPFKTERLIRLVTTCGKNESESVPP
jgi:hypothetical protein